MLDTRVEGREGGEKRKANQFRVATRTAQLEDENGFRRGAVAVIMLYQFFIMRK